MQWICKYHLVLVFILIPLAELVAQENGNEAVQTSGTEIAAVDSAARYLPFVVRAIIITGNTKTKSQIILREVPFKEGDRYQLQDLVKKFEDARRQLMNTSLFHEVIVALKSFEGYNVDISISVKERWYIFPIPVFKMVDRNINEWIDNDASLKRVNYGIKLIYNNSTGHNDPLKVTLMNGYTKQVMLSYDRLYIDKKMKWGFSTGIALGKNREVNYTTIDNKLVAINSANYLRTFLRGKLEFTYRRAIKTRHRFGFAYTEERVSDTIVELNPTYFKFGRNEIHFPELYYNMTYFDVDYIPYPLKGYAAEFSLSKKGFNNIINEYQVIAKGSGTWPIARKTYFNLRAVGSLKAPFKQPFFNQRFLGYEDMGMQGYELFVIDGVAGGYFKAALSREIFNFNVDIPSKRFTSLNRIPFRIYAKVYGNAGYVHNPQGGENHLANRMLYSGGVGVDIVTFYDFVVKLEWSFNPLGQNGLYLHRKNYF